MQKTIRRRPPVQPVEFQAAIHPLLQRIYSARGVQHESELQYQLANLHKPNFKGMADAVSLLADAVVAQAKIIIVGDFDADGATSSALAVLALRAMGLPTVDFLVPNRFEYGYGLTPEIVAVAAGRKPHLLITVDNGIASVDGVAAANRLGIDVLVTDHHLPGAALPDAQCIVNPNQSGCGFPSRHIAGVSVMFYVLLALRQELRRRNGDAA